MTSETSRAALPEALRDAEPKALWRNFAELSAIPRASFHEQEIQDWARRHAEARGLSWKKDAANNTVIYRPGTGRGAEAPPVAVQAHVDMVTEKNAESAHDFAQDPIQLELEGGWLRARGTTLGADNGIGAAAALALLDEPRERDAPPLEVVLTVQEEVGLLGAHAFDGSLLQARTLVNLDTEEWGAVYIGCAGTGGSILTLDLEREAVAGGGVARSAESRPFEAPRLASVSLKGLLGGHSGADISEGRANAVRCGAVLADRVLAALGPAHVRLVSFRGGDKRNAIARECFLSFLVDGGDVPGEGARACGACAPSQPASARQSCMQRFRGVVEECQEAFLAEFGQREPDLRLRVEAERSLEGSQGEAALTPGSADRLLALLLGIPHGPVKYSHAVPGLVETSSNLAAARDLSTAPPHARGPDGKPPPARYELVCATRSTLLPALEAVRAAIRRLGLLCGASIVQKAAYPGWIPEPDAPVVQAAAQAVQAVTGQRPELKAIHAGLECGVLAEKNPGTKCVSFGPTILGAHSPDERILVETVEPFYKATLGLMERLAQIRA